MNTITEERRNNKITFVDVMSCLATLQEDVRRMSEKLGELSRIVKETEREMPGKNGYYTTEGAARYLHVSVRTMQGYGRNHVVRSVKNGKARLYHKRDLDAYLKAFVEESEAHVDGAAIKRVYARPCP